MDVLFKIFLLLLSSFYLDFTSQISAADEKSKDFWSYEEPYGPSHWSEKDRVCSSTERQSPINIITKESKYEEKLDEISLEVFYKSSSGYSLLNNGHSVVLDVIGKSHNVKIRGGNLPEPFRVVSLHLHWDDKNDDGSEHAIDGRKFPLEMHIVTYDETHYDSIEEAVGPKNSLAVLGVLFEISDEDNSALDPLVNHLTRVQQYSTPAIDIHYFDLNQLLPTNRQRYFRYEGSLTTPPCAESVIWTVFESRQKISNEQMEKFRSLKFKGSPEVAAKTVRNWRPLQPLGERLIFRSFNLPGEYLPLDDSLSSQESLQRISSLCLLCVLIEFFQLL